ncbi:MAG: hypothetical protein E7161_00490 [Firmicutes bacterium]|nr:hypothetical protein [Bacillota bacterium]
MSIGRISYHKLKDYFELKKYRKFNIPIKVKNKWTIKSKDFINKEEFIFSSSIINTFSEYVKDNLIYYFGYGDIEKLDKEHYLSHTHEFDAVIEKLYEYPETFYIPKNCKDDYSKRELEFLKSIQKQLLKDGLKDIGVFYKEHSLKKDYEYLYLEYNYDELRKRNIKKVQGINIKKHEKIYKKNY